MGYFRRLTEISIRDHGNRDMLLFLAVVLLGLTGLMILYPASAVISQTETGDSAFFIKRQGVWFLLGVGGLLATALVPLSLLRKAALPSMVLALLLLMLVFVPGIGHTVSSSRESFHRWIGVGSFTFQPSEFAKVSVILFLASVLTREERLHPEYDLRKLAPAILLIGSVLGAIVMEPQYGTTVCILASLILVVYVSGYPLLRLLLLFLSSLPLLFIFAILWEYRLDRFRVWLDPYEFRHGGGYQLVTSFRAFREGGFAGDDLASGFAHRYLTFGHTDFILALFAEDYGWLGVVVLVGLFLFLLWRGARQIQNIEEPFPFLLGVGSLTMLFTQAILNMAVVTGLLPTTGVSLPFFSYGGSSLVVSFLFGGLLVNVSRYSKNGVEERNAHVFR